MLGGLLDRQFGRQSNPRPWANRRRLVPGLCAAYLLLLFVAIPAYSQPQVYIDGTTHGIKLHEHAEYTRTSVERTAPAETVYYRVVRESYKYERVADGTGDYSKEKTVVYLAVNNFKYVRVEDGEGDYVRTDFGGKTTFTKLKTPSSHYDRVADNSGTPASAGQSANYVKVVEKDNCSDVAGSSDPPCTRYFRVADGSGDYAKADTKGETAYTFTLLRAAGITDPINAADYNKVSDYAGSRADISSGRGDYVIVVEKDNCSDDRGSLRACTQFVRVADGSGYYKKVHKEAFTYNVYNRELKQPTTDPPYNIPSSAIGGWSDPNDLQYIKLKFTGGKSNAGDVNFVLSGHGNISELENRINWLDSTMPHSISVPAGVDSLMIGFTLKNDDIVQEPYLTYTLKINGYSGGGVGSSNQFVLHLGSDDKAHLMSKRGQNNPDKYEFWINKDVSTKLSVGYALIVNPTAGSSPVDYHYSSSGLKYKGNPVSSYVTGRFDIPANYDSASQGIGIDMTQEKIRRVINSDDLYNPAIEEVVCSAALVGGDNTVSKWSSPDVCNDDGQLKVVFGRFYDQPDTPSPNHDVQGDWYNDLNLVPTKVLPPDIPIGEYSPGDGPYRYLVNSRLFPDPNGYPAGIGDIYASVGYKPPGSDTYSYKDPFLVYENVQITEKKVYKIVDRGSSVSAPQGENPSGWQTSIPSNRDPKKMVVGSINTFSNGEPNTWSAPTEVGSPLDLNIGFIRTEKTPPTPDNTDNPMPPEHYADDASDMRGTAALYRIIGRRKSPGFGYTPQSLPTIKIIRGRDRDGDCRDATAKAVISEDGSIESIEIEDPGSCYTFPPQVIIEGGGGSGATAVARITTGYANQGTPEYLTVTSIEVTNGGSGYDPPLVVDITGGGGSGATAIANVSSGQIGSFTITNGGSGYTSTPAVTIYKGGVVRGTTKSIISSTGEVISISTDPYFSWSGPTEIEGSKTVDYYSRVIFKKRSKGSSTSTPTGGSYNSQNGVFTPPSGWRYSSFKKRQEIFVVFLPNIHASGRYENGIKILDPAGYNKVINIKPNRFDKGPLVVHVVPPESSLEYSYTPPVQEQESGSPPPSTWQQVVMAPQEQVEILVPSPTQQVVVQQPTQEPVNPPTPTPDPPQQQQVVLQVGDINQDSDGIFTRYDGINWIVVVESDFNGDGSTDGYQDSDGNRYSFSGTFIDKIVVQQPTQDPTEESQVAPTQQVVLKVGDIRYNQDSGTYIRWNGSDWFIVRETDFDGDGNPDGYQDTLGNRYNWVGEFLSIVTTSTPVPTEESQVAPVESVDFTRNSPCNNDGPRNEDPCWLTELVKDINIWDVQWFVDLTPEQRYAIRKSYWYNYVLSLAKIYVFEENIRDILPLEEYWSPTSTVPEPVEKPENLVNPIVSPTVSIYSTKKVFGGRAVVMVATTMITHSHRRDSKVSYFTAQSYSNGRWVDIVHESSEDTRLPGNIAYFSGEYDPSKTYRGRMRECLIADNACSDWVEAVLPKAITLSAYPNPFNPETTISYELSEASDVSLTIYNIQGQVIRTLVASRYQSSGRYHIRWDSRDDRGIPVASGIYFYRIATEQFSRTRKLMLLK